MKNEVSDYIFSEKVRHNYQDGRKVHLEAPAPYFMASSSNLLDSLHNHKDFEQLNIGK